MGSKPALTRGKVIDAAYRLAERQGLSALSARAVATECGVALGTIYNYVPDIAELRTEVMRRFWERAIDEADLRGCACRSSGAVSCCREMACALEASLEGFRAMWLSDLGSLDGRTRQRALEAERACLGSLSEIVRGAFEGDEAILGDVRAALDMDRVADMVWRVVLDGIKRGDGSHSVMLDVLEIALYGTGGKEAGSAIRRV